MPDLWPRKYRSAARDQPLRVIAHQPHVAHLRTMPVNDAYRPDPRFARLGAEYGETVSAADFPQTELRLRHQRAAAEVGLDSLTDEEWISHFGRFQPLPGQPEPIAMAYHGHQFRVYNPQLGDGRGFLAAQMWAHAHTIPGAHPAQAASDRVANDSGSHPAQAVSDRAASDGGPHPAQAASDRVASDSGPHPAQAASDCVASDSGPYPAQAASDRVASDSGPHPAQAASDRVASDSGQRKLMDLGTKGSGLTPFSRHADGRLTLKGGVREALAAAMLESLGVPTCRILSLIETGEELERGDEPSPTRSAVMVRLSHSHIRFGTFQRAAFHNRRDQLTELLEHARTSYYPHLGQGDASGFLHEVVQAQARLCARWVAAGFVHGVLNTDNLNVTGESFDYGPWRFVPHYEPGFTAAYFDHDGLYAFARQPEAVFWNLTQLAGCLKLIAEPDSLLKALNGFGPAYIRELRAAFVMRLGVKSVGEAADQRLLDCTLALLREKGEELRWEPLFFDWFGGFSSAARALGGPRGKIYQGEAFDAFRYALMQHEPDRPERLEHAMFRAPDPEEMLIDEVEALWSAIADNDDWAPLQAKLARLEAARSAWSFS